MSSQGKTSLFTRLLVIVSWAIAIALVAFAGYLGWKVLLESAAGNKPAQVAVAEAPEQPQEAAAEPASLPAVQLSSQVRDIYRKALSHTTIPERPSEEDQNLHRFNRRFGLRDRRQSSRSSPRPCCGQITTSSTTTPTPSRWAWS